MILPMDGDDASGWKPGVPAVFVRGPQMDWDPHFSPRRPLARVRVVGIRPLGSLRPAVSRARSGRAGVVGRRRVP